MRAKTLQDAKDDSINRLMKDLSVDHAKNPDGVLQDQWDPDNENDQGDDEDDGDINIVDRSELYLSDGADAAGEDLVCQGCVDPLIIVC